MSAVSMLNALCRVRSKQREPERERVIAHKEAALALHAVMTTKRPYLRTQYGARASLGKYMPHR
jgi:hypothetical protein